MVYCIVQVWRIPEERMGMKWTRIILSSIVTLALIVGVGMLIAYLRPGNQEIVQIMPVMSLRVERQVERRGEEEQEEDTAEG